ncbi:acyl-CoA synthetase (AMP-forming)/AMP-acid ligase II [Thaumarchaeota archaeon SCGC AB-539-E09]|nr:acyl-CoA synthetase (AMP-forming)/AMP-acid ligase II [Thaumarchaeota archaeon SCGC AB-539-E09]
MTEKMNTNQKHNEKKANTIQGIISFWAQKNPRKIAIISPERKPLTYGNLHRQVKKIVVQLNDFGIRRNDRVAVVLPNGPEMAVSFLAVSSTAAYAPLNPKYKAHEYEFYLTDLNAKAIIIKKGMISPAINIAKELGIEIIRLSPSFKKSAGIFEINTEFSSQKNSGWARTNDVALVLHTSGTTSRPKMVPLTNKNICNSAENIRNVLRISQNDRCLNIMPLFHIHGLIGATLSSISAGASIVCTPGFEVSRFFNWLSEFSPTWYTAVPTMHRAILEQAARNTDLVKNHTLRFIRSSSSALAPQLMRDMEKLFEVPVIESYGMTEASHQMSSNLLPPEKRKAGTVGIASGPDVAIMDEHGKILGTNEIGEIVIRGLNVTSGYENNPKANTEAFIKGWFRTGDLGYFDEDEYLVINGRLKEIINRGGEKISPREIDEVLLGHPEIAQAVTFAVTHKSLGEDVAAAVVLKNKSIVSEDEIQKFVANRTADFKVPRQIIILDEIPKGPTGKIQRIGLADKLELNLDSDEYRKQVEYVPPRTEIEKKLIKIWSKVLGIEDIGIRDNYFRLGGDSISAGQITTYIRDLIVNQDLPLVMFLHAPTIEKMALLLKREKIILPPASLIALQPNGSRTSFYCIHACDGTVFFMGELAQNLGLDQPFYALRAQGLDGKFDPYTKLEDMAAHYLKEIQAIQPEGPYMLGGVGVGGFVAYEMAQQLTMQSHQVDLLVMMDTVLPSSINFYRKPEGLIPAIRYYTERFFDIMNKGDLITIMKELFESKYRHITERFNPRARVWNETLRAIWKYNPKKYSGKTILFMSEKRAGFSKDPQDRIEPWRKYVEKITFHIMPGEHLEYFKEPKVKNLAKILREHFKKIHGNS